MKNTRLQKYLLGAFAVMALASSVSLAQLTNLYIQPYGTNTGGSGSGYQLNVAFGPTNNVQNWFINDEIHSPPGGITNYTVSFDTNNPPPSSPTGATIGSISNSWTYDGILGGTGTTYFDALDNNFWGGATFNMGAYSNLAFDFKYDTNSTIQSNAQQFNWVIDNHLAPDGGGGSGGAFLASFANSGANASNFDGAWHHINIPISSTIPDIAVSKGPGYEWFNGAGTSGTFSFWLANIDLVLNTAPPPPPTMSFTPVVQGLNLWNDKGPNYTRHQVRTDTLGDFNVNWVGHATPGTPVTYSWNYAHAPTNNGAGVNFAITPDTVSSNVFADPDWSATNCFYLTINEVGGTSVVANVTVKTNQPSNNSTAVSVVRLTNNTPTAAGTWSLTFTNDTGFVLTAPGGASTNATIPANLLTDTNGQLNIYSNQVSIFLSATPNNDANYGSYADVTTFDVTGVGTPIHENFVTQAGIVSPFLLLQDQNYGFVPPNVAPNMLFVTSNDWNWLTWTLPDSQFSPIVRTNLGVGGLWLDSPLTNINLYGQTRYTKISKAYQAASTQQYFGLVKRAFSQLQVILPGETNAPNTITGKTGTPDPVSIGGGGLETFTVNAVDSSFHVIPGVFDTVHIDTTDGSAATPVDAALNNGTGTYQVVFMSTGSFTITASDVTHTNISSNTSSLVTAGP